MIGDDDQVERAHQGDAVRTSLTKSDVRLPGRMPGMKPPTCACCRHVVGAEDDGDVK